MSTNGPPAEPPRAARPAPPVQRDRDSTDPAPRVGHSSRSAAVEVRAVADAG
ncbi:hypothetical protein [Streptomyces sp. NPDC015242]|uniref:hypothetical protein n=1 Tax=Streptomyces sp. NPDC015242 TaxID=3364951 RepID=UPI0037032EC4